MVIQGHGLLLLSGVLEDPLSSERKGRERVRWRERLKEGRKEKRRDLNHLGPEVRHRSLLFKLQL